MLDADAVVAFASAKAAAEAAVEAAIAAGINHLETATAYGPSHRYLGQAIERLGLDREQLVITSKVLPDQSLASAQAELRRSLEQLQLVVQLDQLLQKD